MSEQNILARVEPQQNVMLPVSEIQHRLKGVGELIKEVMKEGPEGDFGLIPGTGKKKVLLKPGAEKLCTLFRLAPSYQVTQTELPNGHREVMCVCTLTHIPTGSVWGAAPGSCSTMESKYRWRGGARLCPECGKPAIKVSKFPPRDAPEGTPPGFYCFAKIGGCGFNFAHDDKRITEQSEERQENPDVADQYNTVLKMASKRALVAAVLVTTGASILFTQDMDDEIQPEQTAPPPPKKESHKPTNGVPRGELTDSIASILEKKNGATMYWIVTTGNGTTIGTLDAALKTKCEEAAADDMQVILQWEDAGRGKKLVAVHQPAYAGEVVVDDTIPY